MVNGLATYISCHLLLYLYLFGNTKFAIFDKAFNLIVVVDWQNGGHCTIDYIAQRVGRNGVKTFGPYSERRLLVSIVYADRVFLLHDVTKKISDQGLILDIRVNLITDLSSS